LASVLSHPRNPTEAVLAVEGALHLGLCRSLPFQTCESCRALSPGLGVLAISAHFLPITVPPAVFATIE